MPDIVAAVLSWLVPALIVFGVTAIVVVAIVLIVRRSRRGPRARAAAEAERAPAGAALVALDDAVAELDLEVGLSGALYGGEAAATLRRARMTAQHERDNGFAEYRRLTDDDLLPVEQRRIARRVRAAAERATEQVQRTRTAHGAWVARNVAAIDQLIAAETRLAQLAETMGDPHALVDELAARFDHDEVADASRAAMAATHNAAEAHRLIAEARSGASDPTRSILPLLASAERALRDAESQARRLDEEHRLITQAAAAVSGEIASARQALTAASALRRDLDLDAADRLGSAVRDADAELVTIDATAARRPLAAIDALARLRGRLDLASGDARSAQQRMRGAREALPGTLAAARNALASAGDVVARAGTGADARVRLAAGLDDLAAARASQNPVEALDIARRAMRHAEDARALATYDAAGYR